MYFLPMSSALVVVIATACTGSPAPTDFAPAADKGDFADGTEIVCELLPGSSASVEAIEFEFLSAVLTKHSNSFSLEMKYIDTLESVQETMILDVEDQAFTPTFSATQLVSSWDTPDDFELFGSISLSLVSPDGQNYSEVDGLRLDFLPPIGVNCVNQSSPSLSESELLTLFVANSLEEALSAGAVQLETDVDSLDVRETSLSCFARGGHSLEGSNASAGTCLLDGFTEQYAINVAQGDDGFGIQYSWTVLAREQ